MLQRLAIVVGMSCIILSSACQAKQTVDSVSGLPWISKSSLPKEGKKVLKLIAKGGPFPYKKDGTRFGNYERILPKKAKNYYREYTVRTPGLRHRGARRLVCGGTDKKSIRECYYTADHYKTFKRVKR